jgi:TonB family protein
MKRFVRTLTVLVAMSFAWSAPYAGWAQTPATPNVPPPVSTGRPHSCGQRWYPAEAIRKGIEGQVTLAFTITAQGTLTNIAVAESSGSKLLDDASVACASTFLYKPATRNGQPIDVSWKIKIAWSLSDAPMPVGPPHICPSDLLPADGLIVTSGRVTSMFFHVATDGTVRDVVVNGSSGDDRLDQLAVKCVSQWRYRPHPYELLWGTTTRIPFNVEDTMPMTEFISRPRLANPQDVCPRPASIQERPSADTVLILDVQPDESVKNARVWQSSGSKPLDDYAVTCVSAWRFMPAVQAGHPVKATIPVRLAW